MEVDEQYKIIPVPLIAYTEKRDSCSGCTYKCPNEEPSNLNNMVRDNATGKCYHILILRRAIRGMNGANWEKNLGLVQYYESGGNKECIIDLLQKDVVLHVLVLTGDMEILDSPGIAPAGGKVIGPFLFKEYLGHYRRK